MHNKHMTDYIVQIASQPQLVKAGIPIQLDFEITNKAGKVMLDISHEMKVHLMIVNDDLSWFRHIHPEEQTNGSFSSVVNFPHGGNYLLFIEFKPHGAVQVLSKTEITVLGERVKNNTQAGDKWVSNVDGFTVTLENATDLQTHRQQYLNISIMKDGKRLVYQDLDKHLGAVAHIVMIRKEGKDFLHIHPSSNDKYLIQGESNIEKPGYYGLWVQFKIGGQVHTADFSVNVKQAEDILVTDLPRVHSH